MVSPRPWTEKKKACSSLSHLIVTVVASDLQVGDLLAFNYGYTYELVEVVEASKCFLTLTLEDKEGEQHSRRFRKDRLVPVAN